MLNLEDDDTIDFYFRSIGRTAYNIYAYSGVTVKDKDLKKNLRIIKDQVDFIREYITFVEEGIKKREEKN